MDFLKACSTNIHAVDNLVQTHFSIYRFTDDRALTIERWSHLQQTLARLRSNNVLCAADGGSLWVFGDLDTEQKQLLSTGHAGLGMVQEGTLEDVSAQPGGFKVGGVILLEAIEASLAHALAAEPAIIHVCPWTWLCVAEAETDDVLAESSMIRLHAKMVPSGELYLVPDVVPATCLPLDMSSCGSHGDLVLGPYGQLARVLSVSSRKPLISDESWKHCVVQILKTQGMRLPEDTDWVTVELVEDGGSACIWPAHLCFAAPITQPTRDDPSLRDRDWRRWFISTEEGAIFRNPLAMAEEWFKGGVEKARILQEVARPESTPVSTAEHSAAALIVTAPGSDANLINSPPYVQRSSDQQAAMAGIYPTPPDGFAPGPSHSQFNVATPSVTQPDQVSSNVEALAEGEDVHMKGSEDAPPLEQDAFDMDPEDLFGDVGDFAENEVDDADFNFFDEPDDDPLEGLPVERHEMEVPLKSERAPDRACNDDSGEGLDHAVGLLAQSETALSSEERSSPAIELYPDASMQNQTKPIDPSFQSEHIAPKQERPLSPFRIRERLLPPPVPASVSHQDNGRRPTDRRKSNFAPIMFRESFTRDLQHVPLEPYRKSEKLDFNLKSIPNINLPPTRKRSHLLKHKTESSADEDSSSEADSYEPSSSDDDEEEDLPPKLPWESRKRKRHHELDSLNALAGSTDQLLSDDDLGDEGKNAPPEDVILSVLAAYTHPDVSTHAALQFRSQGEACDDAENMLVLDPTEASNVQLPSIENVYDLSREDIVCIAQIINDQSVSAFKARWKFFPNDTDNNNVRSLASRSSSRIRTQMEQAITTVLPQSEACDLAKIAMTREPLRTPTNTGKTPQGHPRPLQRADSSLAGPDCFQLPPPYVRIQRGADNWEMISTCLSFWETLGIGPTSGPKNLRAFCVFPFNEDLQHLAEHFLSDMGTAYENCKLGSHVYMRNVSEMDDQDNFEDGMAPVELSHEPSLESALNAYAATCVDLGMALSNIASQEKDRAIVVYMLNPFRGRRARQHLCACFWKLFQAYRDHGANGPTSQGRSDIFLQILPIDLVASYDAIVALDAKQMACLAREVYDRCPPTSAAQAGEDTAPLPNFAAPAVELASTAPKRIGFQLASEPPSDLLHEGSILHLAYACSADGQWLTAVWIDSTGKYQSSTSFCMRGKTFADIAERIWEHTREILSARQVLWRVFIVSDCDSMDKSISKCWRSLSSKPRAQPLCVTLASIQKAPVLQLMPSAGANDAQLNGNCDTNFLTPASTPQGTANFTSSPDVSGQGGNAPPTPAPSEAAASIVENDPDAHLTDMTEEAWGVLLSPKLMHVASSGGLANGVVFRRGEGDIEQSLPEPLPSLGVSLHWTIQVKPQGAVDDGSAKQAELTLRELLKMYRNLALLTKARGLETCPIHLMPVHMAAAINGVEGLDGMLAATEAAG
jgi:mediator of RNA polymerase II transcription subunit 13